MSNFDFGGGSGPGPPSRVPVSPQQFAPGGETAAPPKQWQTPPPAPTQQPPAKAGPGGGGITPVGLISLLAIVALMLGAAYIGNRIRPINPGIDSAWRGTDGNAKELTSFLRGEGFTCSDEGTATESHFHRLCAKFDETSKLAIEFAGPTTGEIMRVHVQPQGSLTPEGTAAATRAIELSVPDQTAQRNARTALAAGPSATGRSPGGGVNTDVTGPWGRAGWADGTFTVARTWTGPDVGTFVPGNITTIREKAAQAGYRCDDKTNSLDCQRMANGANWTFTAHQSADPSVLSQIVFTGTINDRRQLDPAEELDVVLPASPELDRMKWFVSRADQRAGQAGFARGVRMVYSVTPTQIIIDAGTACRVEEGSVVC